MRILIAVDFGLFGKAQIEMMCKIGFDRDSRVRVLHVIEPLCWELQTAYPVTMPLSDSIIKERRQAAQNLVHDVALQLKEQTAIEQVDAEVCEGSISDQILASAESFGANLLILGSHGKAGITRFLLGSTSQSVSTHAKCSVMIARSPEVKDSIATAHLKGGP